jgi:hypothetical protein
MLQPLGLSIQDSLQNWRAGFDAICCSLCCTSLLIRSQILIHYMYLLTHMLPNLNSLHSILFFSTSLNYLFNDDFSSWDYTVPVVGWFECTVACRPVARQRPWNMHLYNSCYWAAARKQHQRTDVFCAFRAEMLQAGQVEFCIRLSTFRMCTIIQQNCACNKQKSYKIMRMNMFAAYDKGKPDTENTERLNFAVIKLTTVQVTKLALQ